MAKARKTWKLVLTSIILSVLILAAFTAVFISFIVPSYNITKEQIYSVLTKALPILIGLIFLEIALISSRRSDDDYRDNIDKLAPNAYDSPLYSRPMDDPATGNGVNPSEYDRAGGSYQTVREVIKEVPVEVVKEVVREVPKEIIREVPVPVEKIVEKPVEVVKEVIREVPVEVVKEVQVPVIKEIPVETIVEKPVEVIKEVPVEKIVEVEKTVTVEKEIPSDVDIIIRHDYKPVAVKVPVDRIVEKEVPVDVIKETVYNNATMAEAPAAEERIVERIVEVPVEKIVEKAVEVPVERIIEKTVEVPIEKVVEKTVEVPVEKIIERIVEVPIEKIVEKTVEVPVEVVKEVEVPIIKEVPVEVIKEVEVPVEKIVEKTVEVPVDRVVEKTIEVPVEKTVIVNDISDEELGLRDALAEEINSSREIGYSLVVASFTSRPADVIRRSFDVPVFTIGERVYAILPYTRAEDVEWNIRRINGKFIVVNKNHTPESIIEALSK